MPVINMLNTRYLILPLQGGGTTPLQNPYAMGNAWFINNIQYVDNANQEIETLGNINLHTTAVADKKFEEALGKGNPKASGSVTMTSYEPNKLQYYVKSNTGGIIVFSEIFYPGWTCTVDGKPVEIGRVNYVLRAINIERGNHKVILTFKPKSIMATEYIAYISIAILAICLLLVIIISLKKKA
jgi:uncharacterized membrane protein YfhO